MKTPMIQTPPIKMIQNDYSQLHGWCMTWVISVNYLWLLFCRCKCGNCVIMPTVTECVCCCEIAKVVQKIENNPIRISCITQHEGFNDVCLNRWVLQTAFYQFCRSHGSQTPVEDDATHRYVSVQPACIYALWANDFVTGNIGSLLIGNWHGGAGHCEKSLL